MPRFFSSISTCIYIFHLPKSGEETPKQTPRSTASRPTCDLVLDAPRGRGSVVLMPRVASQLGMSSAMIAGVVVVVWLLAGKAYSCVKTAEIAESPPIGSSHCAAALVIGSLLLGRRFTESTVDSFLWWKKQIFRFNALR